MLRSNIEELEERIKTKKEILHDLVGGKAERLRQEEVYKISCEIDELIVEYMRTQKQFINK